METALLTPPPREFDLSLICAGKTFCVMTLEQVSDSMAPRGGTLNGADKLFPAVEAAYRRTVDALRAYPAQQR